MPGKKRTGLGPRPVRDRYQPTARAEKAKERGQLTQERIDAILARCAEEIAQRKAQQRLDAWTLSLTKMESGERLRYILSTIRDLFRNGYTLTLRKGNREKFKTRRYRIRLPKNFKPVSLQRNLDGTRYTGMCYVGNSDKVEIFFLDVKS